MQTGYFFALFVEPQKARPRYHAGAPFRFIIILSISRFPKCGIGLRQPQRSGSDSGSPCGKPRQHPKRFQTMPFLPGFCRQNEIQSAISSAAVSSFAEEEGILLSARGSSASQFTFSAAVLPACQSSAHRRYSHTPRLHPKSYFAEVQFPHVP